MATSLLDNAAAAHAGRIPAWLERAEALHDQALSNALENPFGAVCSWSGGLPLTRLRMSYNQNRRVPAGAAEHPANGPGPRVMP